MCQILQISCECRKYIITTLSFLSRQSLQIHRNLEDFVDVDVKCHWDGDRKHHVTMLLLNSLATYWLKLATSTIVFASWRQKCSFIVQNKYWLRTKKHLSQYDCVISQQKPAVTVTTIHFYQYIPGSSLQWLRWEHPSSAVLLE